MGREWTQMKKSEGEYDDINWNCEEQPELEGTLTSVKHNIGIHSQTVYTVQTDEGETYNVWESAVLKRLLSEVPQGAYIKLVFLGKKESKKGFGKYKDFDLFIANGTTQNETTPAVETAPVVEAPPANDTPKQTTPVEESEDSDEVPF